MYASKDNHDLIQQQYAQQAQKIIATLEPRAKLINDQLADEFLKKGYIVTKYVMHFNKLHQAHIKALKIKDMDSAYLLLRDISGLSFKLEKKIFWHNTNDLIKITLSKDAFKRGMLISAYIVGVMQDYPKQYPYEYKQKEIEYIEEMYAYILLNHQLSSMINRG